MIRWLGAVILGLASPVLACEAPQNGQAMTPDDPDAPALFIAFGHIPVSQPFGFNLTTCAPGLRDITVDATMPAHQHSMNYTPQTSIGETGEFVTKGMVFHMPGVWRIAVDAGFQTARHAYHFDVTVP